MAQQHPLSPQSAMEIEAKMEKVSSLIASDAQTISEQAKLIEHQRRIIAQQLSVITNVRRELLDIKKQILVNEAKATPSAFRLSLTNQLLALRRELVQLDSAQKSQSSSIANAQLKSTSDSSDVNADTKAQLTDSAMIRTALYMAAGRAMESRRSARERLFIDSYAHRFASFGGGLGYDLLTRFAESLTALNAAKGDAAPVSAEYLAMFTALRTRWIDDAMAFALRTDKQRMREGKTRRSIKQIVVLGCGGGAAFDARNFRLRKLPADAKLFQIDLPEVLRFRAEVMAAHDAETGCDLGVCQHFDVACDLATDSGAEWFSALCSAGFDANVKCLWLAEGVFEYLEAAQWKSVMATVRAQSARDSWLIGEIPNRANVANEEMHALWCALGGRRVVSGVDEPKEEILDAFGFGECSRVCTLGTEESNYGERAPEQYVQYQMAAAPTKGDAITRIQLYRGMKGGDSEDDEDDEEKKEIGGD